MSARYCFLLLWVVLPNCIYSQVYFREVPASQSGLQFVNRLNVADVNFENFTNVGNCSGVGVADFNKDGLTDIFFSANTSSFRLFINKGGFRFSDVTAASGVKGNGNWGTGVSIADVNGDGLPDIYVSHSGNYPAADSQKLCNELFIHQGIDKNGIPRFKEMAKQYRLDLPGSQTTQSVFFDYDRDGDLDVFILNHAKNAYIVLNEASGFRKNPPKNFTNRLLRNDKGSFTDVSAEAGIIASGINFGLGVTVSDMNNDGWPDIYCTSDFEERDQCYINQRNGTFTEMLSRSMGHISFYSMGVDAADINNDGLVDLMTLDMKPSASYRQKVIATQDNDDKFRNMLRFGFHAQYTRNMLQLNQGADTEGMPRFAEIGQLAGVSATDWSWSPLFADFDNDGKKDLYISCGYANNDNLDVKNKYAGSPEAMTQMLRINSRFFKNENGIRFTDVSDKWKTRNERMSYAAAYADFDNDGKLDLVVVNFNEAPTLYRNTGAAGNWLALKLSGKGLNSQAIGAKVLIRTGKEIQVQELQPIRGYESSQDPVLHFGLGSYKQADITITWPDGSVTDLKNQPAGKLLAATQQKNDLPQQLPLVGNRSYRQLSIPESSSWASKQFDHPDFKYQFTLPYKVSDPGQVIASGDINGDGLMDYYVGGEAGAAKFFLVGTADGSFRKQAADYFEQADDNRNAKLADLDGDGKPELVVVSRKGSATQPQQYDRDIQFVCRLYKIQDNGHFKEWPAAFSMISSPVQAIALADMDKDGDLDLFFGGSTTPMLFGRTMPSFVLRNESVNGQFRFVNATIQVLPSPILGLISSADWKDMDGDSFPDLLLAGEWANCRLLKNKSGRFEDISHASGLAMYKGLWSFISAVDVNDDGHLDIIAGNSGLNNSFNVDEKHPMKLYMVRFAQHLPMSIPVLSCFYDDGKEHPVYFRDELLAAVQPLRRHFTNYDSYAKLTTAELITMEGNRTDTVFECNQMRSGVYLNDGKGNFRFTAFPGEAQFSRINTMQRLRNNQWLAGGNFFGFRTQFGWADAMPLTMMAATGTRFSAAGPNTTGLYSSGQVSHIFVYNHNGKERILIFRKNEAPQLFESMD